MNRAAVAVRWVLAACALLGACWTALASAADAVAEPVAQASPGAHGLPESVFLFYNPNTTGMPVDRVVSAIEKFLAFVQRQRVISMSVGYYRRLADMESFLGQRQNAGADPPWFASLSTHYLLSAGYQRGYYPIVCGHEKGEMTYRAMLVVERNSPIQTLSDLAGKRIAMTEVGRDQIPYFNTLMFNGKIDMASYFSQILMTDSPMSSVMGVIYRSADAAVLDKNMFDRLTKNSDRFWKALRIVYVAPPRTITGIAAWRGVPAAVLDNFVDNLVHMADREGGAEVLDKFAIDGLRECGWEDYRKDADDLRQGGFPVPPFEELVSATAR